MPGMMASRRNRSAHRVDNPMLDDGFYQFRHFKRSRKSGGATGGRDWRRKLRKREGEEVARTIRDERSA